MSTPAEVFNVGDLVEVKMVGSLDPMHRGVVVGRVHYVEEGGNHPDEYSCEIMVLGTQNVVIVRAKWVTLLSKSKCASDVL